MDLDRDAQVSDLGLDLEGRKEEGGRRRTNDGKTHEKALSTKVWDGFYFYLGFFKGFGLRPLFPLDLAKPFDVRLVLQTVRAFCLYEGLEVHVGYPHPVYFRREGCL